MNGGDDDSSIEIACELMHETDKAYLIYDGTKRVWIPKSICTGNPQEGVLEVPEWFAMREGLI